MSEQLELFFQKHRQLMDANADAGALRFLCGRAASTMPRDSVAACSWFIEALEVPSKKWFAARVLEHVNPVPRSLLDPLLIAALLEHSPSANRLFVEPCVRTFGVDLVKERVAVLANVAGVAENLGVDKVAYWISRGRN